MVSYQVSMKCHEFDVTAIDEIFTGRQAMVAIGRTATVLLIICIWSLAECSAEESQNPSIKLIRKAISVCGGLDSLKKRRTVNCTGKYFIFSTNNEVAAGSFERSTAPGMFKTHTLIKFVDRNLELETGRDSAAIGWGAMNRGPTQRTPERTRLFTIISSIQDWMSLTPLLEPTRVDLKYVGPSKRRIYRCQVKVDGADKTYSSLQFESDVTLLGISVSSKDNPEVACTFYFDKDKFRIRSAVYRFDERRSNQPKEIDVQYSDYRDVNGVQFPFAEALIEDQRVVTKIEFDRITLSDIIDPAMFSRKDRKEIR